MPPEVRADIAQRALGVFVRQSADVHGLVVAHLEAQAVSCADEAHEVKVAACSRIAAEGCERIFGVVKPCPHLAARVRTPQAASLRPLESQSGHLLKADLLNSRHGQGVRRPGVAFVFPE